ncbi:MAG: hypothetical protein AB7F88_06440 [Pyrinomonadaceae bacterium]
MVRSDRHNFKRFRPCGVAVCLLAMLAMFTSAVSACACAHHQSQAAAEPAPSCHSASHKETSAEPDEPTASDNFHSGCECLVKSPVPAIAAKSESKKISAEKAAAANEPPACYVPILRFSGSESADFDFAAFTYSGVFLTAGPARAPPRL